MTATGGGGRRVRAGRASPQRRGARGALRDTIPRAAHYVRDDLGDFLLAGVLHVTTAIDRAITGGQYSRPHRMSPSPD